MALKLYNSLTKKTETFTPITSGKVNMYTCGPTVYGYISIGNFRTFATSDLINRVLKFNGYDVRLIMNLTDVGHLTGDNEGDADTGEDRLESAADKEGKSAKEIADFYIKHFMGGYETLGFLRPQKFTRATEYIKEQIELVKELEKKGITYKTSDGIYFDTSKFTSYGSLSGMTVESVKEGARVKINPEKKNSTDFALWKFSPTGERRWQEWDSPWGVGFPGWHLECSAMALKELGERLDIHVGGEDLKMHHQNEIAQSECATGKKFSNFWVHGAFLQVDSGRMGRSLGNTYTLDDLEHKKINPMALRYFYMSAHYRSHLNFTWEALKSAENALKKLYLVVEGYKDTKGVQPDATSLAKFATALNDDINMPKALAVMWDLLKGNLSEGVKLVTLLRFDEVLGLGIDQHVGLEVPQNIRDLAQTRVEYRKSGIWDKADQVRRQIDELGYILEDTDAGYKLRKKV